MSRKLPLYPPPGVPGPMSSVNSAVNPEVAPPRLHRSGLRYSWESEVNGKLPALPKMWIKCLVGHDTTTATADNRHGSGMVRAGGRNDRLTSVSKRSNYNMYGRQIRGCWALPKYV
jgi:hypothetical protein